MSLRLIPEGAVVERSYLAIPEPFGIGSTFPNTDEGWAEAVEAAQQKKTGLVEYLTRSLAGFATPEQVEESANAQVRIDLRWVLRHPNGGSTDMAVESYSNVDRLRSRVGV